MSPYENLLQRLDRFIRKYYLNQLLKGGLLLTGCLLLAGLLLIVGEYFFYLPAAVKITLLSLLLAGSLYALVRFILSPLLKMQKLGKTISHQEAAVIIGRHFPEVSDKLLNILQLRAHTAPNESRSLAMAGIEKKTRALSPVPFVQAIPLRKNVLKLLRIVLPIVLIGFLLYLLVPQIFRDGGKRLISATETFYPPPPFTFHLLNPAVAVPYNGDYRLEIKIKGDKLPETLRITLEDEAVAMEKISASQFAFTFTKVRQPIRFRLSGAGYTSGQYTLDVQEFPVPEGFDMLLQYPAYLEQPAEQLQSLSDIRVPEGTRIRWTIKAKFTEAIRLRFGAEGQYPFPLQYQADRDQWQNSLIVRQDTSYQMLFTGRDHHFTDSFLYQIGVIPDKRPALQLSQVRDSITGTQIALSGQASDDYKITRLSFHYYLSDPEGNELRRATTPLPIQPGKIVFFQHYFDLATVPIEPGQIIYYYVEAWDNDAVNGPKHSRSQLFSHRQPAVSELDALMEQNNEQINQNLSQSSKHSAQQEKAMEALQQELLQSGELNWEQQEKLKTLSDRQQQIRSQLEALQKRFALQQEQSRQQELSDNLKEKQEAVREQIDRLADDELQKQLKALEELLAEKNKDQAFNALQKLQQENKLFQMDLERVQELIRQLELQMETEALAKKVEQLAEQQADIEEKTGDQAPTAGLKQEQDRLQEQLEQLMKEELEALKQSAREQEKDLSFSAPEQKGNQASDDMKESSRNLQQNQSEKSKQSQQNAQQNLQEMAQSLMQMAGGMDMQQLDIDIKAVRQLLANLIRYSFSQEALLKTTGTIPVTSPEFRSTTQQQKALQSQAGMIRDSLTALGKRVFQLAPAINKETFEWKDRVDQALSFLENRRVREAAVRQQYAMTHANNLALLLNETLSNMMQMQGQMQGQGQPGSAGKSQQQGKGQQGGQMMQDIITGQQQMGQGMQKMPGQSGKSGQSGDGGDGGQEGQTERQAEQIARMAQQQAALRRQIQDLASMLNSKGIGNRETAALLQEIREAMNQQETDLVNKKLNPELQRRQEAIMTRLLKAEKAIRQQEESDQRAAESGRDEARPIPDQLQQFLQEKRQFYDAYRTSPATLKPFYKNLSDTYLRQIQ